MEFNHLKHLIMAAILLELCQLSNGQCGFADLATSTARNLTSPGWPQNYGDNLNCTWTITSNQGSRIEIYFPVFYTEDINDVLAIYSGTDSKRLNGMFCHPTSYISQTSSVQLVFQTDRSMGQQGFFASYKQISSSFDPNSTSQYPTTCGSTIFAVSEPRMLSSPGWPGLYLNQQDCSWTITASEGRRIIITFLQFATEACCDQLQIFDGTSSAFPEERFQGLVCPEQFLSKNDTIRLRFVSDLTIARHGFQLHFRERPAVTTERPTTKMSTVIETTEARAVEDTKSTELSPTTTTQATAVIMYCSAQTIQSNSNLYVFNDTVIYSSASSLQICNSTNYPLATIRCIPTQLSNMSNSQINTGGVFELSSLRELPCGTTLNDITNITAEELPQLEVLTSQPDLLDEDDVTIATEILSNFQTSSNQEISDTVLLSVTNTISNLAIGVDLTTTDVNRATATKSTLLSTLNAFAYSVSIPGNSTAMINVRTADINIQAVRIAPMDNGNSSNSTLYTDFTFDLSDGSSETSTLVTVPTESLSELARNSLLKTPILYATVIGGRLSLASDQNTSQVVSVSAKNSSGVNFLLEISFGNLQLPKPSTASKKPLKRLLNKAEVSRWDFENLTWKSADQCDQGNPKQPEYICEGFASYSVLFTSKIVPSFVALQAVSIIGCSLSIIFLVATASIHLRYRELRRKPTTMTLINICVCLVAVYFFFVIGVNRAKNKKACDGMTFVLHYFTLTSVVWMSINATQMHKAFTQLSYAKGNSSPAIYSLAYGLPFLLVLVNFSVTTLYLDQYNNPKDIFFESLYRYKHVCWLQAPSLIWGFLLPLGLLMLTNYVIFGILLKKVVCRKQKIRSSAIGVPLVDRLINAIAMVTIMGLTWIFGYFLLIAEDVTYQSIMQWLYTLTNTFQGVMIFYLYCVRRENVRKIWLPKTRSVNLPREFSNTPSQTISNTVSSKVHAKPNESTSL